MELGSRRSYRLRTRQVPLRSWLSSCARIVATKSNKRKIYFFFLVSSLVLHKEARCGKAFFQRRRWNATCGNDLRGRALDFGPRCGGNWPFFQPRGPSADSDTRIPARLWGGCFPLAGARSLVNSATRRHTFFTFVLDDVWGMAPVSSASSTHARGEE